MWDVNTPKETTKISYNQPTTVQTVHSNEIIIEGRSGSEVQPSIFVTVKLKIKSLLLQIPFVSQTEKG